MATTDATGPGPEYRVGDPVEKFGGDYGGPGRVATVIILPGGRIRYGVEHVIAGGFGTFVHIYSGKQLRRLPPPPS